jgi:hypothetical protein
MVPDVDVRATKSAITRSRTGKGARHVKIVGIIFRSAFILAFGFGALWASLPANVGFGAISHLPFADLVRVALGAIVCIGAIVQLFNLPKDEQAYTTWVYIGAACTVTLLCVIAVNNLL